MFWLAVLYKKKNALRIVENGLKNPENMMIEIITDRLGRSTVYSSQNPLDTLGDLRGIITGCGVSIRRTLAELIQSMCLFVNSGVIFYNHLWSCLLSRDRC